MESNMKEKKKSFGNQCQKVGDQWFKGDWESIAITSAHDEPEILTLFQPNGI